MLILSQALSTNFVTHIRAKGDRLIWGCQEKRDVLFTVLVQIGFEKNYASYWKWGFHCLCMVVASGERHFCYYKIARAREHTRA